MEVSPFPIKPMPANPYAKMPEIKPEANLPVANPLAAAGHVKGAKSMIGPYGYGAKPTALPAACPSNELHCPPKQGGSFYDPASVNVEHVYKPVIVQHIHPTHTRIMTHYIYEHQHYYPHTLSQTCDECHYDVQCGRPCFPKPHC
ncbi:MULTISPECIES: CotD family spore coat protein [unclassified Sporolactobacillus]|uniref:CotD family spore coat protein n=1 Tax=unclassified Sporolactobacillus TaxID=2628533 RepID=UPI002368308D|nr:CotD family spore coat protein [Sporolactobacillus sp. CQH2019]MDD9148099.1 CotD family spore coat protein [Sporolactobacillus sp. CQH2019]